MPHQGTSPPHAHPSSPLHFSALRLILHAEQIAAFFQLLQRGFLLKARLGCPLRELLCRQIGISPDYLEQRVQTIFLNGKTVDDLDTTLVHDGGVVALSAAMPGLVGATLRRGGFFAAMRSQITHHEENLSTCAEEGLLTLKLFNMVVQELGPIFLARGVWLPRNVLGSFIKGQGEAFWSHCRGVEADGVAIGPSSLRGREWLAKEDLIYLQVNGEQ